MQTYLSMYKIDAPKLLKILIFNYLFSNGDAHFKNFSILEPPMGDYRLSPAYDLLNSRIHTEDKDFALDDGLLPANLAQGNISFQFKKLSEEAKISEKLFNLLMTLMISKSDEVEKLIATSFLIITSVSTYDKKQQRFKLIDSQNKGYTDLELSTISNVFCDLNIHFKEQHYIKNLYFNSNISPLDIANKITDTIELYSNMEKKPNEVRVLVYYYEENKIKIGPLSVEEIRLKQLKEESLIWRSDLKEWKIASSFEELKSVLIPSPPLLPREKKEI